MYYQKNTEEIAKCAYERSVIVKTLALRSFDRKGLMIVCIMFEENDNLFRKLLKILKVNDISLFD